MEKYNVLIVPAGSGMAVAAIKSLKNDEKVRVITADSNALAPGLYLGDKGYLIPKFTDANFWDKLKKIIVNEKVDLVIPALDPLLLPMAERKEWLEQLGTKVMISDTETITIARDKWRTYIELKDVLPVPKSFIDLEGVRDVSFPLIIKPRDGSGSRDVYIVNSREELGFFYKRVRKPIIQEYLPGNEWSVDCLADFSGKLLFCVPRLRIETKAGISVKGVIRKNNELEKMAKALTNKLKFEGIFFFQAKEDQQGSPKLTEINPRIAGTMSLSNASVSIYSLAVRMYMGEKITVPEVKEGIYITRYFEELYLSEEDLKKVKGV
ncbi:MAG: ATP-grasp domain-containing protein [Thermosipho sp. (in: Bacteria)]|nr:ATP-grasp domain-containing protein [Thermosipho sp. (in: thermotogales)]